MLKQFVVLIAAKAKLPFTFKMLVAALKPTLPPLPLSIGKSLQTANELSTDIIWVARIETFEIGVGNCPETAFTHVPLYTCQELKSLHGPDVLDWKSPTACAKEETEKTTKTNRRKYFGSKILFI